MRIVLATLLLNEMEWLPKLYEQHKDWPGLCGWVFVEAADRVYANVNPEVDHPRWSQASERMIGTGERRPTQVFNGYGDFVAKLYT